MRHLATTVTLLSFLLFGTPVFAYTPTSYSEGITVELPKTVSGDELKKILQEEVEKIDGLRTNIKIDHYYTPGSVKRKIKKYEILVSKWTFWDGASIKIILEPEKEYTTLVFMSPFIKSTMDPRFKYMQPEFETLVARIYSRLGYPTNQ